ncbi:MAG: EamA family transporter [Phycisphaerales bacterium]|nr:EamA family transporter [Phycisphaerales bacterium]
MKAIIFAALAGVCWGVGELFTKSVLHTGRVGPITAIAVRSTVALPVLWAAWFVAVRVLRAEPADWHRAGAPTLLKLALGSGLVAGAAAMIFFYAALHLGEISRVKPIAFALAPAVAAVLAVIVLHEPMTARKAGGVAAILLGIVLLTGR